MSDLDLRALEANFETWKNERGSEMTTSEAFEFYSAEQILKDADLSDDEIRSGIIGGGDDGGIDSIFFFVNRTLILDENDVPSPAMNAELLVVQSKFESGFGETTVTKMDAFVQDLLDYSKDVSGLTYLSSLAKDSIERFRKAYSSILGSPHKLKVRLVYATKSILEIHPKVIQRAEKVKSFVSGKLSAAEVSFEFWGSKQLLEAARSEPNIILPLKMVWYFTTDEGSCVCLVSLKDFAEFLSDDKGNVRRGLFEPNVRDYQGQQNPVNTDIRKTLKGWKSEEFWWLNNGVTILADSCPIAGNKISIERPEIVNGLQTSREVFEYFRTQNDGADERKLLVRVIVPPNEETRTRIIKATNFQTVVPPLSLRATDRIHFDIEDRLKLYELYYDRRKGYYKNLKKPISKIVSVLDLARSVIAIVLRRPSDARSQPQTLTNKEETYLQIFDENADRNVFVACLLIDRQVVSFLKNSGVLSENERTDIRYYVDLFVACALTKTANPTSSQIAALTTIVVNPIDNDTLNEAAKECVIIYKNQGGESKVAKNPKMTTAVITLIQEKFGSGTES